MRDQLQQEEQRERQLQQQQNASLQYMQHRMTVPPAPTPAISTPQHYQNMQVPVEVLKVGGCAANCFLSRFKFMPLDELMFGIKPNKWNVNEENQKSDIKMIKHCLFLRIYQLHTRDRCIATPPLSCTAGSRLFIHQALSHSSAATQGHMRDQIWTTKKKEKEWQRKMRWGSKAGRETGEVKADKRGLTCCAIGQTGEMQIARVRQRQIMLTWHFEWFLGCLCASLSLILCSCVCISVCSTRRNGCVPVYFDPRSLHSPVTVRQLACVCVWHCCASSFYLYELAVSPSVSLSPVLSRALWFFGLHQCWRSGTWQSPLNSCLSATLDPDAV